MNYELYFIYNKVYKVQANNKVQKLQGIKLLLYTQVDTLINNILFASGVGGALV